MRNAVIIVAAGLGKRFGNKTPKQFLKFNGKPMFLWSVDAFASIKSFKQIIVVIPSNMLKSIARKYKMVFEYVAGGKERFDSVKNGLAIVRNDVDFIAVHDASRPLISKRDILYVLKEAKKTKAAIAVEKPRDTIKLVSNNDKILKTLNREYLRNAQTPQIFETILLRRAYSEEIFVNVTDDSQLIENLKVAVATVETKFPNFKVTTKQDFILAEKLMKI
jgi:2-C-methyl-D-erythritol 4-phosphate cytidylyltransferase